MSLLFIFTSTLLTASERVVAAVARQVRLLWLTRRRVSSLCFMIDVMTSRSTSASAASNHRKSLPIIVTVRMRHNLNPLTGTGNYSAHRIIWSWYTGRWWMGCYIWYSEEGTGRGPSPPSPFLAVPNVTAHSSTASVPITVLQLLCGFNMGIKGLKNRTTVTVNFKH